LARHRLAGAVNLDKGGAGYSSDGYGAGNTHRVDTGFSAIFLPSQWRDVVKLLYSPGCESYLPSLEQAT